MKKRTIFIIAGIIILCLLAVVATHAVYGKVRCGWDHTCVPEL